MNKIALITNTFGKYDRQDYCIEVLKKIQKTCSNVTPFLIQHKNDSKIYSEITQLNVLERTSRDILSTDKMLPFVNDILHEGAKLNYDYFALINSDILVSKKLIRFIEEKEPEAVAISRIDVQPLQSIADNIIPVRCEPAGFDCWVFNTKWFKQHSHLFVDMLLGRPHFDVMYAIAMFLNSKDVFVSNDKLIFHPMHQLKSSPQDVCQFFNKNQSETLYPKYEKFWGDLCNNTFLKRPDYGSFLQFNSNEDSIKLEIKKKFLLQNEN
jgi:hypothetical protein